MTTTEAAPAERHWLTRFDPDGGEPYGQLCDCEIGRHHDGNGDLSEPDDASDETTPEQTAPAQDLTITEVLADQLCFTRVIDGKAHIFKAEDHGDGRIELDVTRMEFAAEADTTMWLALIVSGPLTPAGDVVDAEIDAESGVEIGATA